MDPIKKPAASSGASMRNVTTGEKIIGAISRPVLKATTAVDKYLHDPESLGQKVSRMRSGGNDSGYYGQKHSADFAKMQSQRRDEAVAIMKADDRRSKRARSWDTIVQEQKK